jgi:hypothetical protein
MRQSFTKSFFKSPRRDTSFDSTENLSGIGSTVKLMRVKKKTIQRFTPLTNDISTLINEFHNESSALKSVSRLSLQITKP